MAVPPRFSCLQVHACVVVNSNPDLVQVNLLAALEQRLLLLTFMDVLCYIKDFQTATAGKTNTLSGLLKMAAALLIVFLSFFF